MTDEKPIMDQVHDYKKLDFDILAEGMKMCEVLQVNVLVEKLPKSWSDYRNSVKHKKRDIPLEELVAHMKIEEANRLKDKIRKPKPQKTANFKKPGKPKPDGRTVKCYVCGLFGHKAYHCEHCGNRQHVARMNVAENKDDDIIATVVSEVNLVENNTEWEVDTGASKHFCATGEYFTEFEGGNKGKKVYMGNSSSFEVLEKGKVLLKLTSGKTLALNNVLYVPAMRRNLISGGLLNKAGIKLVFEADKLVLSRNNDYIGKGFLNGGLFVIETQLNENKASTSAYIFETIDMWHARLGHVNIHSLKKMMKMNIMPKLDITNFNKCEICVEAKHAKPHFKIVSNRKTELLELIHTNLADFRNTESKGGKHYYITFVDDFSRYTKVYLLRTKYEAENFFLIYKAEVENQLGRRIKWLRSDRGGEYGSNFLKEVCEKNDIIHETSAPYFPQQNGIAERKNRTLKEMMNSLLISSGLSDNMWGDAILSANHILNRVPHKKLDHTPYELWKGYASNLQYLKVWGFLAKFGLPDFKKSTIGSKTVDAVFIGYASNSAAYQFMFLHDYSISQTLLLEEDPKTYEEAIRFIDSSFWKSAINDELESIKYNHTWELVDLPRGFRTIGNKWVFRKKLRLDALESIHKLHVHQMDLKTAFVNGELDEEIYMEQPLGFEVPMNGSDACLYSKMFGTDCVIISLYVDNMLIFSPNIESINKTKSFLSTKFEMTNLGEVDVILGVKVTKTEKGFSLGQTHYVEKVLTKFDSFDVIPVRTPYDSSIHLFKNKGSSVSQTEYAKIIGSLMFLMNYTRPSIAYAVSRLSRYTHNPSNEHWIALKRLLKYLRGTMDWKLSFVCFPAVLEGFCDAKWVSDNDEVSSTSGYVFTLGGATISWKSSKQTCIARSTMESEFIALDLAGQEAEWLRNILAEIPL
ncbi:hypothetical protein V6N13_032201 [Hibiscus sabdariffa]